MYVVGLVELSQRGREKGQSGGNYATLKVFWLPEKDFFYFFKSPLSLIEGLDDVMDRKIRGKKGGGYIAASKVSKKEKDEAAFSGLGTSGDSLEKGSVMPQRPWSKVKSDPHLRPPTQPRS